jgi:hypothetical protein
MGYTIHNSTRLLIDQSVSVHFPFACREGWQRTPLLKFVERPLYRNQAINKLKERQAGRSYSSKELSGCISTVA